MENIGPALKKQWDRYLNAWKYYTFGTALLTFIAVTWVVDLIR